MSYVMRQKRCNSLSALGTYPDRPIQGGSYASRVEHSIQALNSRTGCIPREELIKFTNEEVTKPSLMKSMVNVNSLATGGGFHE